MKRKTTSFILILLAGTLVFPIGSNSFAVTLPVASNDSYGKNENNVLVVAAPGVLVNDTAAAGKTLFAGLVTNVKNGTLILNSNGGFVYVPDVNFHGVDSFRYVANDGTFSSNIANVTITISAVNHLPITRNDIYSVNENATLSIHGRGVLANDTDADGNTLTALLVTNVLNGALTLNQNGSFTYAPHSNFHGVDTFTYKANDGIANSMHLQ
ncbi:MAG: tandem-95 repeat protein [Thaumarchaeota archaeon]|nr:tandem-95 repeat protein [Nitrososphaerota archaeon]MBI3641020.1 tandem-95 repeat protein [Nitrososphaerota archaeon]